MRNYYVALCGAATRRGTCHHRVGAGDKMLMIVSIASGQDLSQLKEQQSTTAGRLVPPKVGLLLPATAASVVPDQLRTELCVKVEVDVLGSIPIPVPNSSYVRSLWT